MIHKPKFRHGPNLSCILQPSLLRQSIAMGIPILQKYQFDAIAFRGLSGGILAGAFAMRLAKTLILVRKPEDSTHSLLMVEGDYAARTYVIVDDVVETGTTADEIQLAIRMAMPKAECLGVLEVLNLHEPWNALIPLENPHGPHVPYVRRVGQLTQRSEPIESEPTLAARLHVVPDLSEGLLRSASSPTLETESEEPQAILF